VARPSAPSNERSRPFWHFWECRCCRTPGEETRQQLLTAAFEEIHRVGFQAASLSRILRHTGLTKGALYHHFPNKQALGYAVVEELIAARVEDFWIRPLEAGDPIDRLVAIITEAGRELTREDIRLGCPLNNLAQEMAPVDEGFRERIEAIYRRWHEGLAAALARGQREGTVRPDIDPAGMAVFIVATLEGCLGLAKTAQDPDLLWQCGGSLIQVLEGLRNKK